MAAVKDGCRGDETELQGPDIVPPVAAVMGEARSR